MLFASLIFLFLSLPLILGLNYILRRHRNVQNIILFLASLFFYAWGEPNFVLVLLLSIVCNWLLALLIHQCKAESTKKLYVLAAVIINLGLLFVFKYLQFFLTQINRIGFVHLPVREIALPIGISFFTFQSLSYVIDVYRGEECQRNPIYVGLYISFFPQLIAGPIVRYNSIARQIADRKESVVSFQDGVLRFMQGFMKKVLLANTTAAIADKAFALAGGDLTVSFAWLGSIAYSLQIFFDFSGYSDMAIGLGKMFGFTFEENFNYPYIAGSVTEFWRRWHISLSTWFRDYVYIPLGGSRTGSSARNYLNLLIVWLLTGIWHGANWTFIIWGLLYFIVLLIEKATPCGAFLQRHKLIGHICTLLIVDLLWVVFRADGIQQAWTYMKTMFGLTETAFWSAQTWVYIKENWAYLLFAILLSSDISIRLRTAIHRRSEKAAWLEPTVNVVKGVCLAVLFAVSIVYLINGNYNPFIYFNF